MTDGLKERRGETIDSYYPYILSVKFSLLVFFVFLISAAIQVFGCTKYDPFDHLLPYHFVEFLSSFLKLLLEGSILQLFHFLKPILGFYFYEKLFRQKLFVLLNFLFFRLFEMSKKYFRLFV